MPSCVERTVGCEPLKRGALQQFHKCFGIKAFGERQACLLEQDASGNDSGRRKMSEFCPQIPNRSENPCIVTIVLQPATVVFHTQRMEAHMETLQHFETLDPENWDEMRALAHRMIIAVPSYTTLHGQYCLRIAVANHRNPQADFDLLAREVVRLGNEIA
jgi:hypothetical protein